MVKLKLSQVKPIVYDEKTKRLIFEYGICRYIGVVEGKEIYEIERCSKKNYENLLNQKK